MESEPDLDVLLSDFDVSDLLAPPPVTSLASNLASNQSSHDSVFLKKAEDEQKLAGMNYTIFVPPDSTVEATDFHVFWNRHVTSANVALAQTSAVLQIRTLANLNYAIYFDTHFYVGGIRILSPVQTYKNCCIYYIEHPLPTIQFQLGDICRFPLVVLSGQEFVLLLKSIETIDDMSIHASFSTFESRQKIGGSLIQPLKKYDNEIRIEIPSVSVKENANFWLQIFSNKLGIPLISWMRPHTMCIYPNLSDIKNPIVTDFVPRRGKKNQVLWISGWGFDPSTIRVTIGNASAIVYDCSDTLIKCIIPDDSNQPSECSIQIANSCIFSTAPTSFLYVK